MRHSYFLLFISLLLGSNYLNAQETIFFAYDQAGNQIRRSFSNDIFSRTANEEESKTKQITVDLNGSNADESKLQFYPNPVKDILHLQWNNEESAFGTEIRIFNLTGQQLQVHIMSNKDNRLNIDFSMYEQGVYMLNIYYSNGKVKSIKVVKA